MAGSRRQRTTGVQSLTPRSLLPIMETLGEKLELEGGFDAISFNGSCAPFVRLDVTSDANSGKGRARIGARFLY